MGRQFKFNQNTYFNKEYNIKFEIEPEVSFNMGDFVRFFADNGAGKTAFFKKIYEFSHDNIIFHNTNIYYVPQNYEDYIFPGRTIKAFFLDYVKNNPGHDAHDSSEQIQSFFQNNDKFLLKAYPKKIRDNSDKFDIETFYKRRMDELSGGQKRLLYILREFLLLRIANTHQDKVLILDEPFNDIDLTNLEFIKKLIENARKDFPHLTIFISTHLQLLDGLNKVIFLKKESEVVRVGFSFNNQNLDYYIKNRYNFE